MLYCLILMVTKSLNIRKDYRGFMLKRNRGMRTDENKIKLSTHFLDPSRSVVALGGQEYKCPDTSSDSSQFFLQSSPGLGRLFQG